MNDQQKRAYVTMMYSKSSRWRKKVAQMSDGQVFAIWQKEQQKKSIAAQKQKAERAQDKPQDDIPF